MVEQTLATELLHEVKAGAKRWFIAFCIMVVLEVATIVGFLWYVSLPVDENCTVTQNANQTSVESSSLSQNVGEN